jgi:predicted metal-dependent phosphoesterase TrpH
VVQGDVLFQEVSYICSMEISLTADLHLHSTFSDGVLKPSELVDMAKVNGLSAIAVTDHDTAAGTDEAMDSGHQHGIEVISGIEISSWYNTTSMHILGYGFKHDDEKFRDHLRKLQDGRSTRNKKIIENLYRLGIKVHIDDLMRYSEYGQTGRPHIARLLVDKGVVRTVEQAFQYYLGRGKAAYAERFKFGAREAIAMIRDAGGTAVLAHPATLDPSLRTIAPLLKSLQQIGLRGIEVFYPSHTPKATKQLKKMAEKNKLLITGGSDFHGFDRSGYNKKEGHGFFHVPYELVETMKKDK